MSRRRRRLRLVHRPGRPLQVTVPRGTGERALRRFLDESTGWIARRLDEERERASRHALALAQPGTVVARRRAARDQARRGTAGSISERHRRSSSAAPTQPRRSTAGTGARPGAWSRRPPRTRPHASASLRADRRPRPAHPLGLLLGARHALVQLAARAGAARGARIRRRPRAAAPASSTTTARAFWALLDQHRPGWRAQSGVAPRAWRGAPGVRPHLALVEENSRSRDELAGCAAPA